MITRLAPAKLNLTLAVVGRRSDGFHDLHSIFVPLDFGDEVRVELAAGSVDTLEVEGEDDLAGPDNLVLRAIEAGRRALGVESPPLAVHLRKRIPVAAGLGGGSSDAAAALTAALEAWAAKLPGERLAGLAALLGSDVPFFLAGSAALVTGRGEDVEPLPPLRGEAPAVLVVTPRVHISTPAVFAAYDAGARPDGPGAFATSRRLAGSWRAGLPASALVALAADLASANDLLPATLAVEPRLGAWRAALAELLGRPVAQSGSGPTAWMLFESAAAAEDAAGRVRAAGARLPALGDSALFVLATRIADRASVRR